MRTRLPNRRASETIGFKFRGAPYAVTFSRFADGQLGEVFVDAEKQGVDSANDARDLALCLSIGLQHGVDLDTLRHAALRDASGVPQGLLGAVCDALAYLEQEQAA